VFAAIGISLDEEQQRLLGMLIDPKNGAEIRNSPRYIVGTELDSGPEQQGILILRIVGKDTSGELLSLLLVALRQGEPGKTCFGDERIGVIEILGHDIRQDSLGFVDLAIVRI